MRRPGQAPVLLDTSVFIDHLRGHQPATAALGALLSSDARVLACVLTRVEVRRGLPARQRERWADLAALVEWLDVDTAVAEAAGDLAERYRRSHAVIDLVDHVIAATTSLRSAQLWTRNVRRFPSLVPLSAPY